MEMNKIPSNMMMGGTQPFGGGPNFGPQMNHFANGMNNCAGNILGGPQGGGFNGMPPVAYGNQNYNSYSSPIGNFLGYQSGGMSGYQSGYSNSGLGSSNSLASMFGMSGTTDSSSYLNSLFGLSGTSSSSNSSLASMFGLSSGTSSSGTNSTASGSYSGDASSYMLGMINQLNLSMTSLTQSFYTQLMSGSTSTTGTATDGTTTTGTTATS